jgi:hypothetical protein
MSRNAHLSVRLDEAEKAELEKIAARLELSVGQLVRKMLTSLAKAEEPAPLFSRVSRKRRTGAPALPAKPPVERRAARAAVVEGPSPQRESEILWLHAHISELIEQMPGHWVALDGGRLIAHGADFSEVYRAARRAGVEIPFVERIPESARPGGPSSPGVWMGL